MIRAVLFDLDGTLVDSSQDLANAVNVALRAVGLPERSVAEVVTFIGGGARQLLERSLGKRTDFYEAALAAWEPAYRRGILEYTRFYPGMIEVVEALADRFPGRLAVHTNKPGDMARTILDGLDASKWFARVVGDGDGWPRKPDASGAKHLLDGLGIAAADAVYIGDSGVDFDTAAAVGMPFLGCGWGFSEGTLQRRGARVAKDAAELRVWLGV